MEIGNPESFSQSDYRTSSKLNNKENEVYLSDNEIRNLLRWAIVFFILVLHEILIIILYSIYETIDTMVLVYHIFLLAIFIGSCSLCIQHSRYRSLKENWKSISIFHVLLPLLSLGEVLICMFYMIYKSQLFPVFHTNFFESYILIPSVLLILIYGGLGIVVAVFIIGGIIYGLVLSIYYIFRGCIRLCLTKREIKLLLNIDENPHISLIEEVKENKMNDNKI